MSRRHRESAPAIALSRCDLAGERLPDLGCDARHISYPSESLIVMIWHMDVGFPTQRLFHTFGYTPQRP